MQSARSVIFETKKEYNKLRFKWRELNNEYSELKVIGDIASVRFYEAVMAYVKEYGLKDPFGPNEDKEDSGNSEIFEEDETKTVFRQVAMETHPDKNGKEYIEIFKDVAKAKKDGKLNEMLEVARKIDIKPNEISIKQINVLEEEVYELEKEIDKIRNSPHWIWYHANNQQKQNILELLLVQLKCLEKK